MKKKAQILLVEDEPNFGAILRDYLELNDYSVSLCRDGESGLETFRKGSYHLCILDVMMPRMDGFTLGGHIRNLDKKVSFIYLTAKVLREDTLKGYRIGADDYITKPFDSELLLLKIKAILRRHSIEEEPDLSADMPIGKYSFNHKLRTLTLGDQVQQLSPRESELLRMLALHINNVMLRAEALKKLWGQDDYFSGRSMDVFMAKLRKYLKDDPSIEIINIHGSGYCLKVEVEE